MVETTETRGGTRAKIVDAAASLLGEDGPAAVTTRRVAERAGVQPPAIYRLFGDKDGLLEAVAEHVLATYVAEKAAVVAAAASDALDPLEDLHAGWRAQIDFGLAHPGVFRLLSDPARAVRSPAYVRGKQVLEERVRRLAAAGRLRVGEARAVGLVQAAGMGVVTTLLATSARDRDPGLADAMWQAVLAQVLADAHAAAAEDGPPAAAVALRAIAPELTALSEAERRLLDDWLARVIDAR